MLLSIIIPVYNLENYIGRCLESCMNQSCMENKYEIICVDDGSKDNSAQIIKKYSEHDNRIKYIHKENGGVSSARNLGLTKASGEYVWFVDGDDWIRKDSIRAIGNIMASISEKPDSVLFDSKVVYEYENQQIDSEPSYKMGGGGYCSLLESYSNSVCYRWFRKCTLIGNGIDFDGSLKYAEDTLLLARFRPVCKSVLLIDMPLYYYYQRNGSVMQDVDAAQHAFCMLKLAKVYKTESRHDSEEVGKRMSNAYIRAMQAFCRDLCLYCSDKNTVKDIIHLLKLKSFYPYGIDRGNFRIDKRQSIKNDIMNWMFGLLSIEPYFWLCWRVCSIIRTRGKTFIFNIDYFAPAFDE